jgi:N-acylneuraminate cytidylyltransferase
MEYKMDESLVLGVIPARAGSKGIANKNLAKIGSKSLLEWSIRSALLSKKINKVMVSTDSQEYGEMSEALGAGVPFLRPAELAQDLSTDYDFMSHLIFELESRSVFPKFIVHLRPTTPFRDPRIIDEAISFFVESERQYTSLRSIHEMSESAYKTFEMDSNGILMQAFNHSYDLDSANSARQKFPLTFNPNGYVDVLSVDFIKRYKRLHGNRVYGFKTPMVTEVDNSKDLEMLNHQLNSSAEHYDILFSEQK